MDINKIIKDVSNELAKTSNENEKFYTGIKEEVTSLIRYLRTAIYPEIFSLRTKGSRIDSEEESLTKAYETIKTIIPFTDPTINPIKLSSNLFSSLKEIKEQLYLDVKAAFEGDPASTSYKEVILSYPSFEAISIYRLSHVVYLSGAKVLSRMMSEYAHKITGIDIHPGANIKNSFFIDHGTGVVIGETTNIGNNVKIYQGVTLGAKSFDLDENGNPIKGIKRHPDIEDNVIIYANATILGGNTVIGEGSVIGGNVWITQSVKPHSIVTIKECKEYGKE